MLSWVFRNRRRLLVVYGVMNPAELPDEVLSSAAEEPFEPGRVVRRRRWTLVRPMPRRVRPGSEGPEDLGADDWLLGPDA